MEKNTTTKIASKTAPKANAQLSKPKQFTGKVMSDKMKDTIVVAIENYKKVPKYEKFVRVTKRFKAHDAGNTKKVGEIVTIEECRPISKDKTFRLVA
jgi:small subunit ribosomal protein S17